LKKLKYILQYDYFYIIALLTIFLILSYFNAIFIIPLIILVILSYRQINLIFTGILFIFILISIIRMDYVPTKINNHVLITDKEFTGNYYRYTINHQFKKYQFTSNNVFNSGDIIKLEGIIEPFKQETIPGGFNAKTYNLSKNIYGAIYQVKARKILGLNLFKIRDIDNPFINLFKDYNFNDIKNLSFLFSLSSIHLTFLISIIIKLLYYLNIGDENKYLIITILLSFFYFIGLSILILRYLLIYLFRLIFKKLNLRMSNLNLNSLTFIIILILKPYAIYNYSFIIIYLMIFFNELISFKNNISNILLVPLLLIPFFIIWQKEVDITLLIFTPVLIYLVKYIYIWLILIVSIIPFLNLINYFNHYFNLMIEFINNYSFKFYFPKFNLILMVIYFGVIAYIFSSTKLKQFMKRFQVLVLIIILGILKINLPLNDQVIFLDVGQGDSAVIFKDNKVVVVDAFNGVTNYLKTNYVKTIDYLILTHNDLDHVKEADDLIKNFKINNLIINRYDDYNLKHPNLIKIGGDNLNVENDLKINFYGPIKNYFNDNDNSVVFKIRVNNLSYLFTGDISKSTEFDLINEYDMFLKSDVLKVPHHGSNTSSSEEFLNIVNPKIAIVSASLRNIYNLPNENIILLIKRMGIDLYETRYDGSIVFKNNNIHTYPP